VLLALLFLFALFAGADIAAALRALRALSWSTLGGVVAAAALAFSAGMLFWAGALPLLAADAEMDRRAPSGNFTLLAARGFARMLRTGFLSYGLELTFSAACAAALISLVPALATKPTPALLGGAALIGTIAVLGSVLLDVLGRLLLVRSAAFGEGASAAFGRAVSLLGVRLGSCLVVSAAFLLLDLIVASIAGMLTGAISGTAFLDPDAEMLALAPRIAVGLAAAAVFAWLEVARMGALSALALDAEGLMGEPEPAPEPPPLAEPVIEALPVEEE
jgi:hypothetical protein